ncbi:4124_t:CDS:1, partial [Acaulospora morrowiae]
EEGEHYYYHYSGEEHVAGIVHPGHYGASRSFMHQFYECSSVLHR